MICPLLAEKLRYERIGESTEVALRVLVEKIGLSDVDIENKALTRQDRAAYCNSQWQSTYEKVIEMPFAIVTSHVCNSRYARRIVSKLDYKILAWDLQPLLATMYQL